MDNFIKLYDPDRKTIKKYKEMGYLIPLREELSSVDFSIKSDGKQANIIIPIKISNLSFNDNLNTHDVCFIVSEESCIMITYDNFIDYDSSNFPKTLTGIECYMEIINQILYDQRSYIGNYFQIRLMYLSNKIFNYDVALDTNISHRQILKSLGKLSDYIDSVNQLSSKLKRSIECIEYSFDNLSKDNLKMFSVYKTDIEAINDTAQMLSTKIGFLLDSTLGFVNIDQNNMMKLLTISSSVLIAPTLIAGIYGMNFSYIPGGDNHYGFEIVSLLMGMMIIIPLTFFIKKGWFKKQ